MAFEVIVLPGEGIGPEVTAEAVRVLDWFAAHRGLDVNLRLESHGTAAHAKHGQVIADSVFADLLSADAVLFGATGGPAFDELPEAARKAGGLLRMRRHMEVFANIRPIVACPELADATSLKADVVDGVDMVIVRELNGGIYFGEPRGLERLDDETERGVNTLVYETPEIERIARFAFELARKRGGHVHSVDKSNVLETHKLWRKVVSRVGAEDYADVPLSHIIVDNCAMQIIREPKQFDVILADNMFGDILSDLAGAIVGSLGMLPSASLSAPDAAGRRRALYEPVHGSAPDIAGRGIANPIGAMLSVGLALHHSFGRGDDAKLLARAVRRTLGAGIRTPDIRAPNAKAVSTKGMGDAVLRELTRLNGG